MKINFNDISNAVSLIIAFASLLVAFGSLIVSCYTFKYKSQEDLLSKENVLLNLPSNKIVPRDILKYINVGTSVDFAKSILGQPEIVGDYTRMYFELKDWEEDSQYKTYSYFFKNADIKIITEDDKTISAVVVQRGDEKFSIDIPQIPNVSIGDATVKKMLNICNKRKDREIGYLGRGDITYVAQCYFGIEGQYKWYSFGYFNAGCYDQEANTFDYRELEHQKIEFFTISHSPRFATAILDKTISDYTVGMGNE